MGYSPRAMALRPFIFAVALSVLAPFAAAQDDSFAPRDGVLVLRNGHVVQGQIARLGDRYTVAIGPSSEVRFPLGDVEFQCATLDEAYLRKRDLLDPTSIRQRLDLAEWCLRHELANRAADQLLAALTINAYDVRGRALQRRLLQMAEAREIASHPAPAAPETDWQALDQVLATVPTEAVEKFATGIQPLLLNRCGTSACHGSQASTGFHLMRPLKDKTLPRRLTQRNLYATLQAIDDGDPDRSPLLTVPRGPHGGEKPEMFDGRREAQWLDLREWVRAAARRVDPATGQAALSSETSPSSKAVAKTESSTAFRPTTDAIANGDIHRSVYSTPRASTDPGLPAPPRDPFDPDIFNRRYFPEKFTPSTENSPAAPESKN